MRALLSASFIAGALVSGAAVACQFDVDCHTGGKCLKEFGADYGVCFGGSRPGNEGDRRPPLQGRDPNHTVGNTCHLDAECGTGSECLKAPGGGAGVCYSYKP